MPLTDQQLGHALHGFVHAAGPVLDRLAVGDLVAPDDTTSGLLARARARLGSATAPGTATWSTLPVDERSDWWLTRIGALVGLAGSAPELLGPVSERAGATAAVQVAGRGLLLCAIAREHGVRDVTAQEALLARVLWARDLTPRAEAPRSTPTGRPHENGRGLPDVVRSTVRIGRDLAALHGAVTDELSSLVPQRRRGVLGRFGPVAAFRSFTEMKAQLRDDAAAAAGLLETRGGADGGRPSEQYITGSTEERA